MRSVLKYILALAFFASLASAAPKIKNFVLSEVISGSWLVSQKVYAMESKTIVEDYGITQYNVSKSEIPSEFIFVHVDPSTGKKLPESFEYIVAATSNRTGIVKKYEPSAEEDVVDLFNLLVQTQLVDDIEAAYGSIPGTDLTYDFSVYSRDDVVLKITDNGSSEITVVSAKRIPPKIHLSWFRRYGPYAILGAGLFLQLLVMMCQ